MRLVFDIESDGLLDTISKVHCIATCDLDNNNAITKYGPQDINKAVQALESADELIGHNIIGFDIPAIQSLYAGFSPKGKITDTLILGRLQYSDIKSTDYDLHKRNVLPGKLIGAHKLEAWGYRLDLLKGNYGDTTDWSEYSPEMMAYMVRDVEITFHLYNYLMESWEGPSEESYVIEHEVAQIIWEQEQHGVFFNTSEAEKLYVTINEKREQLRDTLSNELFGPFYVKGKEFTPKRDNKRLGYVEGCPSTKIKYTEFNPGSRDHIAYWLKRKYDWKPTALTDTGKPKLDETILEDLPYPEGKPLADFFMLTKRLGMLGDGDNAWLKLVTDKNRIHGYVNSNGTVTGRMSHSKPNLAQVTAKGKVYGEECRALFTVPKGYKLVGCDASGLELRMLGHYLCYFGGEDYAKEIVSGDIHTMNMNLLGIDDRNVAKTFILNVRMT